MNTDDIVKFDFLRSLSGAKTKEAVSKWLADNRIHYWQDATGKPVTIRDNLLIKSESNTKKVSKLRLANGS